MRPLGAPARCEPRGTRPLCPSRLRRAWLVCASQPRRCRSAVHTVPGFPSRARRGTLRFACYESLAHRWRRYFKSVARANIVRDNVFHDGPRSGVNWNDGPSGHHAAACAFPYFCAPATASRTARVLHHSCVSSRLVSSRLVSSRLLSDTRSRGWRGTAGQPAAELCEGEQRVRRLRLRRLSLSPSP